MQFLSRCCSQNVLLGFGNDAAAGLKQRRLVSKNLRALAEMRRKNEAKCVNIEEKELESRPSSF